MKIPGLLVTGFILIAFISAPASGQIYKDYVDFNRLINQYGQAAPTGDGVKVAQVEAQDNNGNYMPDINAAEFSGKVITQRSSLDSSVSWHATTVGKAFFGNNSIAPGLVDVDAYVASPGWLGSDYLDVGARQAPLVSDSRVANHSWAGTYQDDSYDSEALRRLDYVVETDDFINVVGTNNGSEILNLLAGSRNAIAVGLASGSHAEGTNTIDAD